LLPTVVSQLHGAEPPEAAELSVLIAETLTRLGDTSAARRWWWAARAAADGVGTGATVRAREAIIGLAERRPLPELLELADQAIALDRQNYLPRAARALVWPSKARANRRSVHCRS
jgi:hypothetical protein